MSFVRRAANVLFAVGQAAVPALGALGLYGRTIDAQFQTVETPVVPADAAFTIWSLIFLLCFLYALDQARPSRADDPVYRRIGGLTALAFAGNTAWSLVAQQELPLVLTGLIFFVTFAAMLVAAPRLFGGANGTDHQLARLAVGTLAGWVSVAFFANWSVILANNGFGDMPGVASQALVFIAAAGGVAALLVSRTGGALPYVLTVAWALVWIIVVNIEQGVTGVAYGAGLCLAAITALAIRTRRRVATTEAAR